MNDRTLKALEYYTIMEKAAFYAVSERAKKRLREMKPLDNIDDIENALSLTEEADIILHEHAVNPSLNFDDITEALNKATVLSMLTMGEILRVARVLRVSRTLRSQIVGVTDDRIKLIREKAETLYINKYLEDLIEKSIISDTEMSDQASDELASIRAKMRKIAENIKIKLRNYVTGSEYSKYLQTAIITIRNDRYVLPVKAEFRGAIPGLIHDQSASGATLFVEPMAIVELNNDLKSCIIDEKAEIDRILRSFTSKISAESGFIRYNFDVITEMDVVFAKARYANLLHCVRPELNSKGIVDIKRGRHPLIDKDKVIANDIRVGDDFDLLMITGPNTGGKTVCLKMLGLIELLGLSGFFVPAEYAKLAVFDDIFCDIGDEQSIEQSLSTFSSHMSKIVSIIDGITENTLVLLDELGAGTDPAEGAALALGITEYFLKHGVKGVITTHYNELKEFAVVTERVTNASMDFNPITYSPTYKLIIGMPGASNALMISEKLGLNREIIESAQRHISGEKFEFENVLLALEKTRKEAEEMYEQAEEAKKAAQNERLEVEREREKLFEQRERLNVSVKKETKRLVDAAMQEANEIIDEMRKLLDNPTDADIFRAQKLRKSLTKYVINEDNEFYGLSEEIDGEIVVGDRVLIKSVNSEGEVVKINPIKGEAKVKLGKIETNVKLENLQRLKKTEKKNEKKKTAPTKAVLFNEQVSPEINLIGMTSIEAVAALEDYIEKCLRVQLHEIRIIHGYGEGILRKAVRNYLATRKEIDSYRDGQFNEGGKGVTFAVFK